MPPAPRDGITLHSSWRGIIGSLLTGVIVSGVGVAGAVRAGWTLVPSAVGIAGALLLAVALFDYPVACRISADGVQRRMMLRRQHFEWGEIEQLSRERPRLVRGLRRLQVGGLVAVVGKRRYLLVDQPESSDEHDAMDEVLGERAEVVGFDVIGRPEAGVLPTWTYRRHRWQSDPRA